MAVRVEKPEFNLREKISELDKPYGLKGNELLRSETSQEARGLIGAGRKNLIINGDMRINQRGTSSHTLNSGNPSAYIVDRFLVQGGEGTYVVSQDTDVPTGQGFDNSIKIDCTGADTSLSANFETYIQYLPESRDLTHLAYGTSDAKTLSCLESFVVFVFAGNEKSLSKELLDFIKVNNIAENIIFTGWLDHELEIKYYYKDADVIVSIPLSDSSPFSVYEAMAVKKPVIVSNLPWIDGKFINNQDLVTVDCNDNKKLSQLILDILKNKLTLDLNNAHKIIKEKINMKIENERLNQYYKYILSK